jgi:hypothetical protein
MYVDTDILDEKHLGWLFHVEGSLLNGMEFDEKHADHPFVSATGETIQQIGWISHGDFPQRIREMCEGIPPPKKQYNLRSNRLFLNEPICHCQHWAREAIDALLDAGVLEPLGPDDNGGIQKRPDTVLGFARGVKRLSRSRATRNSNNLKEIHSTPSLDATSIDDIINYHFKARSWVVRPYPLNQ